MIWQAIVDIWNWLSRNPLVVWIFGFVPGVVAGIISKIYGDIFTERRHKREALNEHLSVYNSITSYSPDMLRLLLSLRNGITRSPLLTDFVPIYDTDDEGRKNRPGHIYIEPAQTLPPCLQVLSQNNCIVLLSHSGFTNGMYSRYKMLPHFIDLLKQDDSLTAKV